MLDNFLHLVGNVEINEVILIESFVSSKENIMINFTLFLVKTCAVNQMLLLYKYHQLQIVNNETVF